VNFNTNAAFIISGEHLIPDGGRQTITPRPHFESAQFFMENLGFKDCDFENLIKMSLWRQPRAVEVIRERRGIDELERRGRR
jgi:hypothetical protein